MTIDEGHNNYCQSTLTQRQCIFKRSFDILLAFGLLLVTWPIILIGAILATIDTRQNGFFTQRRIGQYGKPFSVIKLATMRHVPGINTSITAASDPRITGIGQILRRTKIDELPQLFNVLKGDMSFVGPRPDVPGFADQLQGEDRAILCIRPGITGPATLEYRHEQELLSGCENPEEYNRNIIFPEKVRLNRIYIKNYSFRADLKYIFQTIFE